MVLGIYYLTQERPGNKGEGKFFKSVNEAILAYENKVITLQSRIHVRCSKTMPDGSVLTGTVESTLGRTLSRLGKTTCYGSGYYPWTSCEYNSYGAFVYGGSTGGVNSNFKYGTFAVRPVSAL